MPFLVKDRTGEAGTDALGNKIFICKYEGTKKIRVRWEDGTELDSSYYKFTHQKIYKEKPKKQILNPERLGETLEMNCGMKATIIRYGKYTDIDIEFEDGYISKNRQYSEFVRGGISNPNCKLDRVGETNTASNGQKMTIIAYRGCNDIDVEFEDGYIATNILYKAFIKGNVANLGYKRSSKEGMTVLMKNGQMATLIKYYNSENVTVKFEDGTIVENQHTSHFYKGYIKNPNYSPIKNKDRIGEEKAQTCGMKCKIIEYRSADDIDVEFEDGNIVYSKKYSSFTHGYIQHPKYKGSYKALSIIGEKKEMKNGQMAEIIDANNLQDITVRFEDGTVVSPRRYTDWCDGGIGNPNINPNIKDRSGEVRKMNCGLNAKIVKYHTWNKIDVEFEDGEKVSSSYGVYKKKSVKHPLLGIKNSVYHGFLTKKSFSENGDTYYICSCTRCGEENIFTPYQMLEHSKTHNPITSAAENT